MWGENVSKSKCPFAECYIYLVTSARGCALLVPGNNWPLPAAPRPELRASVSAPRVSEVRILTLASTSGTRSLVLLQMPSKWVNTLWLYKLILKHLPNYRTKFYYIDFVWPLTPSSLMDIWYLVSNKQEICQKSWKMACRKKVRFLGLAQIYPFSDEGFLKNI